MSDFSSLVIPQPSDTITVGEWHDAIDKFNALVTGLNNGLITSGVTWGRSSEKVQYPWDYETVGVSEPVYNLRLQSPLSIFHHIGNQQNSSLTIRENGNVGIGTDNPAGKLEVAGDAVIDGWLYVNGSDLRLGMKDGRKQGSKTNNRALAHIDWGIGEDNLVINFDGDFEGGVQVQGPKLVVDNRLEVHGAKDHVPLYIKSNIERNGTESLMLETNFGWMKLGVRNSDWAHFHTDRPKYYFNQAIAVDSGEIGSYDEDLKLKTGNDTRITINKSSGDVTIHGNLRIKGKIIFEGNGLIEGGQYFNLHAGKVEVKTGIGGQADNGMYVSGGNIALSFGKGYGRAKAGGGYEWLKF
jgi:hypothetical protein